MRKRQRNKGKITTTIPRQSTLCVWEEEGKDELRRNLSSCAAI